MSLSSSRIMCNLIIIQWGKKCCPHDSFSHRFRPLCIPSITFDLFKHLVASLRCNVEVHPQQFELVDVGLLKEGRRGWRTNASACWFFWSIPLRFPNYMQSHQNPVGKSAFHTALSHLPVRYLRPLCILSTVASLFHHPVASLALMWYSIFSDSTLSKWV